VPPRVGAQWVRMQLHTLDTGWGREELRRMLLRYAGARLMLPQAGTPVGWLACVCRHWAARAEALGEEQVAYEELRQAIGDGRLPVAGASVCGEIAPQGVTLGGLDQRRTARHGHTASCCLISYEPRGLVADETQQTPE